MRVRTLFGRHKLPASKRTGQPSFRGKVDDQVRQTLRSLPLPLPTAFSPRHPNSFRMERGLYKYTTGLRTPSSSIRRSFDVIHAALKVYSAKALSTSECTRVRNLLSADENYPPATSLIAALRHMYHVTARAYTVVDSIAGVFFQVYREKTTLKPLRLPWITLGPSSRQWNISCETYRSHPNSTISVPRICLSIINFREPFRVQRGPWSKGENIIAVNVSADLRTSILQYNATEDQIHDHTTNGTSNACIQSIVDDIVCAMARVTVQPGIGNHEDLITKLRNAISTNLKSSALPSLVKFREMEIKLQEPYRQRFVSNTLLNPDGSEQNGDSNGQDVQRSPIIVTCGNSVGNSTMSEGTKEKLGVEILKASVDILPGASIKSLPITAAELVQEFDILCRNSDETGLGCCIEAINALEQRHEEIDGRLAFNVIDPLSPTPLKIGEAVFHIHRKVNIGQHFIEIANTGDPVKVRLSDSTQTVVRIVDAQLGFDVSQYSDQGLQDFGSARSTAADEVSVLSIAFGSICQQILEKMEFRSLDETTFKLAEAVLEILKIPSSSIMIKAVSLGIQPVDDPQTLFRAQASQGTEPYSTGSPSDAVVSPSNDALTRGNGDATQARPTTHEASYQAPLVTPIPRAKMGKSMPTGHAAEATPISKSKFLGLEVSKSRSSTVALASTWITSKIVEDKTGFEAFRAILVWPTHTDGPPSDLTAGRLTQQVEETLQACTMTSVSTLQAAFSKIFDFEPHPQRVTLSFWKAKLHLPAHISLSDALRPSGLEIQIRTADSASNNSVSSTDSTLFIVLPAFTAPVQLEGRILTPDTKAYLLFLLEGVFPHKVHHQETPVVEQMCRVIQIVHSISAELLNGRSFPNFQAVASDLSNAVFEKRHDFGMVIGVRSVKLTAHLRKNNRESPTIEKAEALRTAQSNINKEGKAQHEPSKTTSLMLDQEEEAEMAEEREIEVQSPGTSLSILEPRNNEATEEQREVSVDSSTTIREISEPVYEAQATEEQRASENESENRTQTAFIALGSNVGDRLDNIENACREMDADPDIRIVRTSPLYETNPMYVADQDSFLNGACEIKTTLKPVELLDRLKAIEDRLGRVKTVDKGPRSIDLDILLYENVAMATDRLTIPHPLMHEREFALRPVSDIGIVRNRAVEWGMSVENALDLLPKAPFPMYPSVPLGSETQYLHVSNPKRATRMMSVLNVTPDSFSDGGDNQISSIGKLQDTIRAQIEAGATIIDVGGQSSRPNAPDVTAEEEMSRVLPAIEAIRSLPEAANIAISVDTYRARVAEAAVKAGAHIINDISAGKLDPDMFTTVARLGCTYVMMHMRGTPSTMMDPENCTYRKGVLREIPVELRAQLNRAEEAGIRRWRIILDPGIGFSKTLEQNLEVLTRLSHLKAAFPTYPWLVGTSRKSFIGKITGVTEPKERVWGTAATVTAAVQGGADIVRVHDVREMADVVKMADSMYRV